MSISPNKCEVVLSEQEILTTGEILGEDHYKNVMSADPVSARLPYTVITKMVATPGWNIFEMNGSMTFAGIKESTSLEIRRRSLVFNLKGKVSQSEGDG